MISCVMPRVLRFCGRFEEPYITIRFDRAPYH
jgi:hypothetical protein